MKRQIIDDDDDDDDVKDPLEQLAQLASVAARSRATSTASRYVSPDDDQPKPSTSKAARPSKKLKKRKAEDEEEDYEVDIEALNDDLATMAPELEFDDDSTFEDDEVPRRKKPAAKAPAKGARAGKGKAGSSKAKPPDKPILMKDERKTPVIKSGIAPPPAKRLKKNEDDELTSPLSAKDPSLPVSAPRKKLPNIKKNKDIASATSTPPPPLTRVANKPATQTTVDLDLNDSSIYGQLFNKSVCVLSHLFSWLTFSQAGGNTPRSGLNRAEERKAEINKMRQEARAKRELEAVSPLLSSRFCIDDAAFSSDVTSTCKLTRKRYCVTKSPCGLIGAAFSTLTSWVPNGRRSTIGLRDIALPPTGMVW